MELLGEFFRIFLKEMGRMWWFTLLGITFAALIKTYQLDRIVRQYVGRYGVFSIFVATAVGCLSPLCSCGILPIVIPMALSGVPLPPLFALLATSPTMDPTSFMLTMGALGPELAWWKFGGSVFLGLLFGFAALFFVRIGFFSGNLVRLKPVLNEKGELASAYEIGLANGILLRTMVVVPRASKFRFFLDRLRDVGVFVAFWVVAAVAMEAAIHVLVPVSAVTWLVGQKGLFSVVAAALVGVPLPLHQIPAIPVLAGLIEKGMAAGADIAFLMAGPVTSIPAIAALYAIFIPRVVVIFVALGFFGSIFLGLLRMAAG